MIGRWNIQKATNQVRTDYLILHERGDRPLAAPRAACSTPLFPESDAAEFLCIMYESCTVIIIGDNDFFSLKLMSLILCSLLLYS